MTSRESKLEALSTSSRSDRRRPSSGAVLGSISQKIGLLETRTNQRGFFRSPKPPAINFPLQVQWIVRGHSISTDPSQGGPIKRVRDNCDEDFAWECPRSGSCM